MTSLVLGQRQEGEGLEEEGDARPWTKVARRKGHDAGTLSVHRQLLPSQTLLPPSLLPASLVTRIKAQAAPNKREASK